MTRAVKRPGKWKRYAARSHRFEAQDLETRDLEFERHGMLRP